MRSKLFSISAGMIGVFLFSFLQALASEGGGATESHVFAFTFLWIAVILLFAKVGSLVERWGQPSVLGELVVGIIFGNLALIGIHIFDGLTHDAYLPFLAELGVVILLFQVGLESTVAQMRKVGLKAFLVAMVGVILPFALATLFVGPVLLPGLSFHTYLFLGAALTATSVGITARVFRDLKKLHIPEAQIVLGAAVIDDVLGLIILAVVSAIVSVGTVTLGAILWIVLKAFLFLGASIFLGRILAENLSRFFSKIHSGVGMKFGLAVSFGLAFAFVAQGIGLAPIVGAFAAGLVLEGVHFRFFRHPEIVDRIREKLDDAEPQTKAQVTRELNAHAERHVEDLLEPLAHFLVPIFFVMTGIAVDISTLFDMKILLTALGVTAVAFAGKMLAGFAIGKINRSAWLIGFGMVPRGEVGLIFATIGRGLGVVSAEVFSIIVIMVIFTTLLTPPILTYLLKKQ